MSRFSSWLLALCLGCVHAAFVPADSPLVRWTGRVFRPGDGSVHGDWAGLTASITLVNNFTYVRAQVRDMCGNGNKFAVLMDGEGAASLRIATLYTSPVQQEYLLFGSTGRLSFWGASATFHVVKTVEARFTQCSEPNASLAFLGFDTDGSFTSPPPPASRRMEVIGDSITSGDLVYCATGHLNNSLWADDWAVSYGALLCRTFGADCSTVSWGGMGLLAGDVANWTWPTLPDVYNWTLAWQGMVDGQGAPYAYPWDFAAFTPQAVLINLGTNDAAGERFNNATFKTLFQERYVQFVANISSIYTGVGGVQPAFFLGYGPMSLAYEPAVAQVVQTLTGLGYKAVPINYTLPAPCQCGHPSDTDHAEMAAIARPVIAATMGW